MRAHPEPRPILAAHGYGLWRGQARLGPEWWNGPLAIGEERRNPTGVGQVGLNWLQECTASRF